MNIPELSDATGAVEGKARSLIPWLPNPYECPDCNVLCEADFVYDPRTAAFNNGACPAWVCPECGAEYYRDEPWF